MVVEMADFFPIPIFFAFSNHSFSNEDDFLM